MSANRRLPPLDLLRGFECAARHLNFTRAAEELFLTQSAVSRQIQTLEEHLCVRLFLRERHGLRLTLDGDRLFRAVQSALNQVNDVVDSMSPRDDDQRVTVTSTMAFSSLWLVPRLGEFNRSFPEVDVRIAANDRVLDMEREHIDVAVRYCAENLAPPDARWLFAEELTPVCSPALLPESRKHLRDPEELSQFVLLHIDDRDNPSPWLSWNTWLDAVGGGRMKPAGSVRFNYFDQCVRAALAGHGVALGRFPLVDDLLRDGSLVAPFATRIASNRSYWLVRRKAASPRPYVDRFADWILESVAKRSPGAAAQASSDESPHPRHRKNRA